MVAARQGRAEHQPPQHIPPASALLNVAHLRTGRCLILHKARAVKGRRAQYCHCAQVGEALPKLRVARRAEHLWGGVAERQHGSIGQGAFEHAIATGTPANRQLEGDPCQQRKECNACHQAAGSPCTACRRGCHGPASTRRSWAACQDATPASLALHCGLRMGGQDVRKCSGLMSGCCTCGPALQTATNCLGGTARILWLRMHPARPAGPPAKASTERWTHPRGPSVCSAGRCPAGTLPSHRAQSARL